MHKLTFLLVILMTPMLGIANTEKSVLPGIETFVEQVAAEVEKQGISWNDLQLDHLTYVAASIEDYLMLQTKLGEVGSILYEGVVNKRAQTAYKLFTPIILADRTLSVVEIASPAPKSLQKGSFEQIKLQVNSIAQLVDQYAHVQFNKREMYRPGNPEVSLESKIGVIRFREAAYTLEKRVAGYVGEHLSVLVNMAGTFSQNILTEGQKQHLLNSSEINLPFDLMSVGPWTFSLKEFAQPSEKRINTHETTNVLCLSGKIKVELGTTVFILTPGDSLQIPPAISFKFIPFDNSKAKVLLTEIL